MQIEKNIILKGSDDKPIATDIFCLNTKVPKPVVIYAHGFNGFKDWGNFDLIAAQFASQGFTFIKFNFSHNGTTPETPDDFTDLEAYSDNNYTKELYDLGAVIDWASSPDNPHAAHMDYNQVYLLGHSMGGGIALIKASEDRRVKALATWASIAECNTPWGSWPSEKIKDWIDKEIAHVTNSRTGQEMPLKYQLFDDYQFNKQRLDIERAIKLLEIPLLICHGLSDTSVKVEKAYKLRDWKPEAELFLVDSDHVFGRKHPWAQTTLPEAMQTVIEETIRFFKKIGYRNDIQVAK
ncbi:MAG: alpha/beta fold hydrolase [Sphingobacteriales bacterium]|nr:MAG: alpha/beta fold hydrolase [Sphingobacteriales bacterium]